MVGSARIRFSMLMVACLVLLMMVGGRAQGTGYVWYVDASVATSGNGSSWASAFADLQSAITAAQSGDTIRVAEGTYKPTAGTNRAITFQLNPGLTWEGGYHAVTGERNPGQYKTILSGEIGDPVSKTDNSYRVITAVLWNRDNVNPVGYSASIDGFTISGGYADGETDYRYLGGGMSVEYGRLTVTNSTFSDNYSLGSGGGLNTSAQLTMSGVTFTGNSTRSAGGALAINNQFDVSNTTFDHNSAGNYGGAVLVQDKTCGSLTHVTFSDNSAADHGAAMAVDGEDGNGPCVFLRNSIVYDSDARRTHDNGYGETVTVGEFTLGKRSGLPISDSIVLGGCPWDVGSNHVDCAPNVLTSDPLLGPLANHGGPTMTMAISANSPAVDTAGAQYGTNTDQRGVKRPQGGGFDMGAYEGQFVADSTPPEITNMPSDQVLEATSGDGAVVTYTLPTATDAINGPVAVTCAPASGTMIPLGTATVTCTASDSSDNVASASFYVTVQDTTPPVMSNVPADMTIPSPTGFGLLYYTSPSAEDVVAGAVQVKCLPASGTLIPSGANVVTCTAVDRFFNKTIRTFTATVGPWRAPVVVLPATFTVEANVFGGGMVTLAPAATDAKGVAIAVTCSHSLPGVLPVGTTTVTCSATDSYGKTGYASVVVTVTDTTTPVLPALPNLVAEAAGPAGAPVTFTTPTVSDLVDGSITLGCVPASGATFALGTTQVTCTGADKAGNAATATFTVTVKDTTAPTLPTLSNISFEATGAAGATVTYPVPAAADLVDGALTPVCLPASGSTFGVGSTPVQCSATDAHGNIVAAGFTVTVSDTTPPALVSMPSNITMGATGPNGAVVTYTMPMATDLVDGALTPVCLPASGSTFGVGSTPVQCSATDAHGNIVNGGFTVTVGDTTAPTIGGMPNLSVSATGPNGAVVTFGLPAASDAVDGLLAPACSPASGSTFAIGTTTVTCTATDKAGNSASTGFNVSVSDTVAPVVAVHPDVTAQATSASGAIVTYSSPAWTDAVAGNGVATCAPLSGSTFPIGSTTVRCSATDAGGNTGTSTFMVTVSDTVAPVVAAHANVTVPATSASGAIVTYSSPAWTDAVAGSGVAMCAPASGSTFAVGTTTVTCTAKDAAGNVGSNSFTVTVTPFTPNTNCLAGPGHQVLQPIAGTGKSVFARKAGSTIPVKFRVCDASGVSITTNPVTSFQIVGMAAGTAAPDVNTDEVLGTVDGAFRWSSGDQVWMLNMSTGSFQSGYTYVFRINLNDGTNIQFQVGLK